MRNISEVESLKLGYLDAKLKVRVEVKGGWDFCSSEFILLCF